MRFPYRRRNDELYVQPLKFPFVIRLSPLRIFLTNTKVMFGSGKFKGKCKKKKIERKSKRKEKVKENKK